MKKTLVILFLLLMANTAYSDSIQDITKSIRSVCVAPDQKGKYWEVDASGDTKVKIKLIGSHIGLSGEISSGEWEGVQQVLKEQQASNNEDYRKCAKELTPLFIKSFSSGKRLTDPVMIKDGNFSIDLTVYEEGDIPKELGEGLVIQKINNKMVVSGLHKGSKGVLKIKNLNLKNKFRVEIVIDINYGGPDIILRTRDDDIDNDIKITMDTNYIYFGDKQDSLSHANYKKDINEFVIYKKNDVIKFIINDKYFSSKQSSKNLVYNKLIVKGIAQKDYIYDITGYNINN